MTRPTSATSRDYQNKHELGFYTQQTAERQSRSRSRAKHPSESSSLVSQTSRPDRSRSKSRDIVAMCTSGHVPQRCRSATPVGSLRSYLYVPPTENEDAASTARSRTCTPASPWSTITSRRTLPYDYDEFKFPSEPTTDDRYRRARSLVREPTDRDSTLRSTASQYSRRARSETRASLVSRDAISLCSNLSTQSRALSNSEIASQNLELWMSTTSKNQRPSSKTRRSKRDDRKDKFVTMLEMDAKVNERIEKLLNNANSVKPANVRMMVIAGHTPSEDWESKDEIKVKPGELVTGLYKQNEWLYISTEKGSRSGYVPYAYTKAVKITTLDSANSQHSNSNHTSQRNQQKEVKKAYHDRCEREENRPKTDRNVPPDMSAADYLPYKSSFPLKHTPRAVEKQRDSLSSSNTAFLEEIMCPRPSGVSRQFGQPREFADCLVVDTDSKSNVMIDEDIRICSDSGISEPNSNHSDDLDPYVSLSNRQVSHYVNISTPGSRSSLESSGPQEDCRAKRMYKNFRNSDFESNFHSHHQPSNNDQLSAQSNAMPFGPLGQRLQHDAVYQGRTTTNEHAYEQPVYCNISQDMQSRAQAVSNIPSTLKPEIPKDYNGPRARVVYDYLGQNEDDIAVRSGDVVTVLNAEDVEWIWVMRKDGVEGFMPREFVISVPVNRSQQRNYAQQYRELLVTL